MGDQLVQQVQAALVGPTRPNTACCGASDYASEVTLALINMHVHTAPLSAATLAAAYCDAVLLDIYKCFKSRKLKNKFWASPLNRQPSRLVEGQMAAVQMDSSRAGLRVVIANKRLTTTKSVVTRDRLVHVRLASRIPLVKLRLRADARDHLI